MSRVLSLRLKDEQMERLKRLARRQGHLPSKVAAILIEEALRMADFRHVEFRDSPIGRQVYVRGSRVTVWMLMSIARDYEGDPKRVAEHLGWPVWRVQGGFDYARAFPEEIAEAIADNDSYDDDKRKQILPQLDRFTFSDEQVTPATSPAGEHAESDAASAAR